MGAYGFSPPQGGGGGGSTSPLTTKGDLWVYDSADVRLPIGSNGQRLQADSADAQGMIWAPTDIGCRVFHSADQSIANSTVVYLAFDSERYDTDTMHDTAVNNSRITFTTAGKYHVFANIRFASNAVGRRQVLLELNRSGVYVAAEYLDASVNTITVIGVGGVYNFAANDYIEVAVVQGSGGALNVDVGANYSPEFGAQKCDRGG